MAPIVSLDGVDVGTERLDGRPRLPRWWRSAFAVLVFFVATGVFSSVVPYLVFKLSASDCPKTKFDISALAGAVVGYALDNGGQFPASLSDLVSGQDRYLDINTVPLDSWGRPYGYEPPEPGGKAFRIFSLGEDGKPGGEGDDQDIDNLLVQGKI